MLKIYKDDQTREVNNIDAAAWIKNGWSLNLPNSKDKDVVDGVTIQETFMTTLPPSEVEMQRNIEIDRSLININQATAEEIANLPGVGTKTASTLINGRPYKTIADLEKVLPKIDWRTLKDKITFE